MIFFYNNFEIDNDLLVWTNELGNFIIIVYLIDAQVARMDLFYILNFYKI